MTDFDPNPKPKEPSAGPFDAWAGRIAAVWIWTALFGLNGGLSYSFLGGAGQLGLSALWMGSGFGPGRGRGPQANDFAVMILSFAFALGLMASLAAWLFLYLQFSSYLVPVVLLGVRPFEDRRQRLSARYLMRAYQLLLIAGLARVAPDVLFLFLPAMERFGFW